MVVKELCVVLLLVSFTSAQNAGGVNNGPPSSRTGTASSTGSATSSSPGTEANSQFLSPEDMYRLKQFLASLPDLGTPPSSQQAVVASSTNRHHHTVTAQRGLLPVAHVQTPTTEPAKQINGAQQQITPNQKQQSHPSTQQQQLQIQPQLHHQQQPPELQQQHLYPPNLQGVSGFQSSTFNNPHYINLHVNNHISAYEKLHLGYSFGLSDEQKFKVLENHNKYRSDIPFSSAMNVLRWNETLAERAAAEINSCLYFNKGNGAIYAMIYEKHTGTSLISEAVSRWANEKNRFRLKAPCNETKSCRYSQIVWADTKEVGCARQTCNDMSMVACMYHPPGNVIGGKAYQPGRPCSNCEPGSKCNSDQLCEW